MLQNHMGGHWSLHVELVLVLQNHMGGHFVWSWSWCYRIIWVVTGHFVWSWSWCYRIIWVVTSCGVGPGPTESYGWSLRVVLVLVLQNHMGGHFVWSWSWSYRIIWVVTSCGVGPGATVSHMYSELDCLYIVTPCYLYSDIGILCSCCLVFSVPMVSRALRVM